jgi:chromosomal replication initiator protein
LNIFEQIKQQLKSENDVNYNKFIHNLSLDESSSLNEIKIIAPNIFIANYVKRRYFKKFKEIYKSLTGIEPTIEISTKKVVKKEPIIHIQKSLPEESTSLIPEYTFDTFVVGASNQFAYTAAKNVAQNPGQIYNPLFIYGGVGLGKTHLLHAIGNHLKDKYKVIYISSEQFLNDFRKHLASSKMDEFREKYRSCDILLIDDVQFFAGKEDTQEEFFHTFNELYQNKKQICLSSDRPPKKINNLVERLKSRFGAGLIVDIQPPELITKIKIIKNKCLLNGFKIPEEVIEYMATELDINLREIEGVITKINAYAKIVGINEITIDFARQALKDYEGDKKEDINLDDIIKLIAKEFNVKPSEILSKSRNRNIVLARRCAIYLAREVTQESTPNIAKYFGLKDHSAISHAIKAFKKKLEEKEFRMKVEELKSKITIKK